MIEHIQVGQLKPGGICFSYLTERQELCWCFIHVLGKCPRFDQLIYIQFLVKYMYGFSSFQVAKTLKKNESLKACIRCNSPAKYDCYLQRATCKRESCGFDYCTKCLCTYHTTEDCSNGKPLKASYKMGPLPGTKKSKKNLRRL